MCQCPPEEQLPRNEKKGRTKINSLIFGKTSGKTWPTDHFFRRCRFGPTQRSSFGSNKLRLPPCVPRRYMALTVWLLEVYAHIAPALLKRIQDRGIPAVLFEHTELLQSRFLMLQTEYAS